MDRLHLRLLCLVIVALTKVKADAVTAEDSLPTEQLAAEHRSEGGRSAEPDSFLERIADLFGGGQPKPAQNKVARPGPVYRGPTLKQGPPRQQQQQASILRPQSVQPPAGFKRPSGLPSGLQSSQSNAIKRQTTGMEEDFLFHFYVFMIVTWRVMEHLGHFQFLKLHIYLLCN